MLKGAVRPVCLGVNFYEEKLRNSNHGLTQTSVTLLLTILQRDWTCPDVVRASLIVHEKISCCCCIYIIMCHSFVAVLVDGMYKQKLYCQTIAFDKDN